MLNGGSCEKVVRSGDEAKETSEGRERRVGRLSVMAKCRSPLTGPSGGK